MNRTEEIEANIPYHVFNRGNRKQPIFGDQSDYASFMEKLQKGSDKYLVKTIGYCLMPNHFHLLLLQSPEGSISSLMISLTTSTAKRYNLKYHETGHLFGGPYCYKRIDTDQSLINVACYIHLNPVSAGLVEKPEEWQYSDFRGYTLPQAGGFLPCGMTKILLSEKCGNIKKYLREEEYVQLVRFYSAQPDSFSKYIGENF